MKKAFFMLVLSLGLVMCHHGGHHGAMAASVSPTLRVVASTFPVYLFTANVCAGLENVHVELLVPSSLGCPHDFTLRPADMRKLVQADVLVLNGAGLEEFLDKPLQTLEKKPAVIDASVDVTKLPAPGMELDPHAHGHAHNINPHTFAAPANAVIMSANVANGLAALDPANAEQYRSNTEKYQAALEEISQSLEKLGKNAKNRAIAIEHDALAYLARNAELQIVASFENGDSAALMARLVANLKKEQPALLAGDSQYPDRVLKTISAETGLPFAQLNPCASGPENPPLDYYQTVMKENCGILEKYFE